MLPFVVFTRLFVLIFATGSDQQVKIVLRLPPPDAPSPLIVSLPLDIARGRKRDRSSWQPIGPPSLEEVELTSSSEEENEVALTPPTQREPSASGKVFHTTPPNVGKPSIRHQVSRPSPSLGKPSSFVHQPAGKPYHFSRKSISPEPKKPDANLIVEIDLDRLSSHQGKKHKKHKSSKAPPVYEVVPPVLTTPPPSLPSPRHDAKKKKKKKHKHHHHHHKSGKTITMDSPITSSKKEPDPTNFSPVPTNFSPVPVSLTRRKSYRSPETPNSISDHLPNPTLKPLPEPVPKVLPDPAPKPLSECLSPPSIENIRVQPNEPIRRELERPRPLNRSRRDMHRVRKQLSSTRDPDSYQQHVQTSSPAENSL